MTVVMTWTQVKEIQRALEEYETEKESKFILTPLELFNDGLETAQYVSEIHDESSFARPDYILGDDTEALEELGETIIFDSVDYIDIITNATGSTFKEITLSFINRYVDIETESNFRIVQGVVRDIMGVDKNTEVEFPNRFNS